MPLNRPSDEGISPVLDDSPAGLVARPAGLDSAASILANSFVYFLGIPTSILIARALGPSGKGIATLVATIVVQGGLLSLGFESAIFFAAGRRLATLRELGGVAVKAAGVLGPLASCIAAGLLLSVFRDAIPTSVLPWAIVAMLALPLSMFSGFLSSLLAGSGRIIEVSVLGSVLAALSLASAAVVFVMDLTVSALLILNLVALAFAASVTLGVAFRYGLLPPASAQRSIIFPLARYGMKSHVGTVLHGLGRRVDLLIVGVYLSTGAIGIYSVAVTAAETLWIFPTFLGTVVFQRAASLPSVDSARFTALTCRITASIVAVGAMIWLLVGRLLIGLMFGSEFLGAVRPLYILLPGLLMLALWSTLTNDLMGRGLPQYKSYSAGVALVVTILFSLVMIPSLGIVGAALASTFGYASAFVVSWVLFHRVTGAKMLSIVVPQRGDAVAIRASMRASFDYLRHRSGTASPDD